METFYHVFQQSLNFAIPLLIVALGGMFSEKSGVINIALEGIMIIGAFTGAMFLAAVRGNEFFSANPQLKFILAIILGAVSGMIFASLLAFASVNMKADQTIGGRP